VSAKGAKRKRRNKKKKIAQSCAKKNKKRDGHPNHNKGHHWNSNPQKINCELTDPTPRLELRPLHTDLKDRDVRRALGPNDPMPYVLMEDF